MMKPLYKLRSNGVLHELTYIHPEHGEILLDGVVGIDVGVHPSELEVVVKLSGLVVSIEVTPQKPIERVKQ